MKPLIYGYMRVSDDMSEEQMDAAEQQMRFFAEVEGYCYAVTFFEYQRGSFGAFTEMVNELKRVEARHVVVPSLDHLSAHRILLTHLLERLSEEANAYAHEAGAS